MESILDSIKKMLGITGEDFDQELLLHINGALMIANQLGVGPTEGFRITDNTQQWSDFMGDRKDLELVKVGVYLRTLLSFDPPQNSFLVNAIEKQIQECDWRIEINHIAPTPIVENNNPEDL